jgi:hypothetical protein
MSSSRIYFRGLVGASDPGAMSATSKNVTVLLVFWQNDSSFYGTHAYSTDF